MKSFCPALEFEAIAGISGIGRRYKTTDPRTLEEIDAEYNELGWRSHPMEEWHPAYKAKYDAGEMEGPLDPKVYRKYQKALYHDLLALNPELRTIRHKSWNEDDVGYIVSGALSGFSPADIDYFIHRPYARLPLNHQQTYLATGQWPDNMHIIHRAAAYYTLQHDIYTAALETKIGASIYWVESPATIRLIKEKMGIAGWEPSQEEWRKALRHRRVAIADEITLSDSHPLFIPQSLSQMEQTVADICRPIFLRPSRPATAPSPALEI